MILSPLRIGESARSAVIERLAEGFDGYAAMMRCSLGQHGWGMDFGFDSGPGRDLRLRQRFQKYLVEAPIAWTLWDPLNVAPDDRNRAKIVDNSKFTDVPIVRELYVPAGIDRLGHLTFIASRGPRLLGWIGLWREKPFNAQDRARLDAQGREIAERLSVADELEGPSVTWSVLEAALDALDQPAFLMSHAGRAELANTAGRSLLQREGRGLMSTLLRALEKGDPAWRVTPIRDSCAPPMALIVLRPPPAQNDFEQRLTRLASTWHLTKTQRGVLHMVARGLSNKEIACACQRSERTIELHVSSILRRVGVDSRSRLLVRFWA